MSIKKSVYSVTEPNVVWGRIRAYVRERERERQTLQQKMDGWSKTIQFYIFAESPMQQYCMSVFPISIY